ncbi:ribosomal protein S18-alanine N-acetyltransferase [Massilia sp. Dwa41.01b]|uniref:ribosomal protein S18-alanine N-acetyltransferase n=1 Tax=unclassified Massilia TaxID=2609279 RepID=UPI0015FF5689|nr:MULTISPECIES: ribosomal protein S18-alanine N-acetyltransferase [unclassified Massilia]QNA91032.1 ribosomal protein S18-alanine N-acetyltransferase [Massilia sp. Dwa41.01b]QNB01413.1 ribosomal protein S18-alanine N-acetyltransferase [Massilia sp. Se16.2.3]
MASAAGPAAGLALVPMGPGDVDEVHALECSVFPHPWSRANFADSLDAGYDAWLLRDAEGKLAGYFLLMYALDEAHLLDVAVAGERHGTGLGRYLLETLCARAREMGAESVLLEVRPTNERALHVYRRFGFDEIGRRKGYYPAHEGKREDAIVMRCSV